MSLVRAKNSAQLDDIRLCVGVRWNDDASWSRDQIMCVPKSETRKDLASKVMRQAVDRRSGKFFGGRADSQDRVTANPILGSIVIARG